MCSLSYVGVQDAAMAVVDRGRGALMAKVDVQSTYRHTPIHPDDQWLMGMLWEGVRLALATLLSYSSLAEQSPQVPHKQDNCSLALLCSTASKSLLNTKLSQKNDLNCVHKDKL